MRTVFTIIHIIVSVALVGSIMIQSRKSGGFTGAFGGGGTQMDNSGTWQRMSSMTKVTAGLLVAFMLLAMIQVIISR